MNTPNAFDETPLHSLARHQLLIDGHTNNPLQSDLIQCFQFIILLINNNINFNHKNISGETAFDLSYKNHFYEFANYLYQIGSFHLI